MLHRPRKGVTFFLLISGLLIFAPGTYPQQSKPSPLRLWGENQTDSPANEDIRLGMNYYYNFEFDKALACFDRIITQHPRNPIGYFFQAETYWWMTLNKEDDPMLNDKFREAARWAVSLAQRLLKENPDDIEALFILGICHSRIGMLLGRMGDKSAAASQIMKGRSYIQKALQKDPSLFDCYGPLGIYDYYVATQSNVVRLFSALFYQLWGSREEGIKKLELASQKGIYSRYEAKFYLALFYLKFEQRYQEAERLLTELHQKYPNNFSFYGMLAYTKLKLKHFHQAISMYQEILQKAQEQNIYGKEGLDTTLYFYSEALRRAERYEESLKVLRQIIESNREKNNWLLVYGHLDSGRCYDMLGQREKAIAEYGEVLRLKSYEKSHQKARQYLKSPYMARN